MYMVTRLTIENQRHHQQLADYSIDRHLWKKLGYRRDRHDADVGVHSLSLI